MAEDDPLACPRCARRYPLSERFCADDGMPLVYVGRGEHQPPSGAHERARKVKPQYRRGELVKVAGGRHLAEAELIQGILLEEGIPSVQKRSRGFDVPDFLAAGPRDILVPEAAYEDARALLTAAETRDGAAATDRPGLTGEPEAAGYPLRLLAGVLGAAVAAAAIVWLLYQAVV